MKSVEERLRSYEPLWENWRYTGEFLGEGAMSSVFEIKSSKIGIEEYAALKIVTVKSDSSGMIHIPETIMNEIKILNTLSSCPNIVNYHDSTQRDVLDDSGNKCGLDVLIKMEKLRPLNEGTHLSEDEVVKLAHDMCTALVYANDHRVIHRDIKPQNMFVDKDGIYKLGDFGIAKVVSRLIRSNTVSVGTMAYVAPEVWQSTTGDYDISADIYSLGLSLYVFLNEGYLPFASSCSSIDQAVTKRFSGAPFPSPKHGSDKLKKIIMRACEFSTVNRYSDPGDMLRDIERMTGGAAVIDPFATLDANEACSSEPVVEERVTPPSRPGEASPKIPTGSRVKISMGSKSDAPARKSTPPAAPAEAPKTPTGSRLKISMGSKSSRETILPPSAKKSGKPAAPVEAPKTPAEEEKDNNFLNSPDLL